MSNSILTNASAMTALQTLNATNKSMSEVQNRISTGQRVSSAQDNAAYWSIATTMRSDNNALSAVQDALGLGAATVDTMYTAMNSTVKVVDEIKAKLVAAKQPGVDRGKIQSDISELQNQLKTVSDSAVFNSENWLSSDVSTVTSKDVVSSFSRAGGSITIQTISIDITSTQLIDTTVGGAGTGGTGILDQSRTAAGGNMLGDSILTLDISGITDNAADLAALDAAIGDVDAALSEITDSATLLGSVKTRIDLQKDFVDALTDALDRGIGQLVDADMNEESTRLKALQVQQQLGIQALSIANSSSDNILSLFR